MYTFSFRTLTIWLALLTLGLSSPYSIAATPSDAAPATLSFNDVSYFHRWSKAGQNEFTPAADTDLSRWNEMITINVFDQVHDGEQLAVIANRVLENYQRGGKILGTNSTPRTKTQPAEHFIVAVLGAPALLEAAFCRMVLVDGVGVAVVYSHRLYGENAGPEMADWLVKNGQHTEQVIRAWKQIPTAAALQTLPQNQE